MDFEDIKGYFTVPNMAMIGGAVGGFVLGTIVGDWVADRFGGDDMQKTLGMLVGGLGLGAIMYALGRNMEPGSSFKPVVYGLAIGAAMPGVMATIGSLLNKNPSTQKASALFARGLIKSGANSGGFTIERIE